MLEETHGLIVIFSNSHSHDRGKHCKECRWGSGAWGDDEHRSGGEANLPSHKKAEGVTTDCQSWSGRRSSEYDGLANVIPYHIQGAIADFFADNERVDW